MNHSVDRKPRRVELGATQLIFAVAVLAAACGGTTEPPEGERIVIARFENLPADTAIDVTEDLVLPIRAVDTKGNVIVDLQSKVTVTSNQPTIASAGSVASASTTIAGNGFGTAILTVTASNSNVAGATPVTATINVKVRPKAIVVPLPTGAGHVEVYGVSDDGTIGGGAFDRSGNNSSKAWRYSAVMGNQLLPTLTPRDQLSQVRAVAGDGSMVGYSLSSTFRLTRWSPAGVATDLGQDGFARGVNRSGAVLYYAFTAVSGGAKNLTFYRASDGTVTGLGEMGAREVMGSGLADDGGVVGNAAERGPFYWTLAQGTTFIPVTTSIASASAVGVGGRVVGNEAYGPGGLSSRGYYWSPTDGFTSIAGFDSDIYVYATDVSDGGVAVGSSMPGGGTLQSPARPRAFVWTKNAGLFDLTGKLPRPTQAFAVSNSGVYAAGTMWVSETNSERNEQPVLWILRRP